MKTDWRSQVEKILKEQFTLEFKDEHLNDEFYNAFFYRGFTAYEAAEEIFSINRECLECLDGLK